jgi:hypothetical protein
MFLVCPDVIGTNQNITISANSASRAKRVVNALSEEVSHHSAMEYNLFYPSIIRSNNRNLDP